MSGAVRIGNPKRHVLLTGQPGVGKTTLVKKVCEKLEEMNWMCEGFFTEELREDGERVGFDVVTLDGKRGALARVVDRDNPVAGRSYMVGRYNVTLQTFEQTAMPALKIKPSESNKLVVIDEIGKMELFSRVFVQTVKEILKHPQVTVLATIPSKGNPFVEEIRHSENAIVYTVTKENRYRLIDEIVDATKDALEFYGG